VEFPVLPTGHGAHSDCLCYTLSNYEAEGEQRMKWTQLVVLLLVITQSITLWMCIGANWGTKEPHRALHAPIKASAKESSPAIASNSAMLNYINQVFGKQAKTALNIAKEHDLNCKYGVGTTHIGLFAIDTTDARIGDADLANCYDNIDVAKKIYNDEGFFPWGK
jgi:hypothetical protein